MPRSSSTRDGGLLFELREFGWLVAPDATSRDDPAWRFAGRLDDLSRAGGLPRTLTEAAMRGDDLDALAADAATQWTGTFNPRPFDARAARELYERALAPD